MLRVVTWSAAVLSVLLLFPAAALAQAAITGLELGGGKAVIIGDSRKDKTPARASCPAGRVPTCGSVRCGRPSRAGVAADHDGLVATAFSDSPHIRAAIAARLKLPESRSPARTDAIRVPARGSRSRS